MKYLFACFFAVLSFSPQLSAQCASCQPADGANGSHHSDRYGAYPFSEDGNAGTTKYISSTWSTLMSGCDLDGNSNIVPAAGQSVNSLLHAYIDVVSISPTPPSGTVVSYEVTLSVDGTVWGDFIRQYVGTPNQGDYFSAVAVNVPSSPAKHSYSVSARTLTSGYTLTVSNVLTSSQAAPTSLVAGRTVLSSPVSTAAGTWTQLMSLNFSTTQKIDVLPNYYLEFTAPSRHHLSVSIAVDGVSRISEIVAPASGTTGVNVMGYANGLLSGSHTLEAWVVDRDGGVVTASRGQLDFISFLQSNTDAVMAYSDQPPSGHTNPETIHSYADTEEPQFTNTGCGGWTKLVEFDMPAANGANWTGAGYVELLGHPAHNGSTQNWTNPRGEVAVETVTNAVSEMGWYTIDIPADRGQVNFSLDSMLWGNSPPNHVTLWIRKDTCAGGSGTFNVGKRYLAVKLVPSDNSCHE
jgi:hypothetical protein